MNDAGRSRPQRPSSPAADGDGPGSGPAPVLFDPGEFGWFNTGEPVAIGGDDELAAVDSALEHGPGSARFGCTVHHVGPIGAVFREADPKERARSS